MTGRLVIHDPVSGESRTIPATQLALEMFLAGSGGRTLSVGRLACCDDGVERAWPLRSVPSSERDQPVRPGSSPHPHAAADAGPVPQPSRGDQAMSRTDVSHIIDADTRIDARVSNCGVASCYGTVNFGDLSLSHQPLHSLNNAPMTVRQFIAALREAASHLEEEFKAWDEERLRQASEDAAAELDDSTLPPFLGDAAHRHAPTGDHLLPGAF